jgi:hypothetical protein
MPNLAVLVFVLRTYLLPLMLTAVCDSGRVSFGEVGDIGDVMADIGSSSVTRGCVPADGVEGEYVRMKMARNTVKTP